jgi:hypothetical protein
MTFIERSAAVAPAVRQAALLLHAMPMSDRAWLLEQLPREQRLQLTPLVEELQELGIPQDRVLVEQTLAAQEHGQSDMDGPPVDARVKAPLPDSQRLLAQLDSAGCSELADVLRDEPPMLIARLLLLGPWPWEHELLGHFGVIKRRQIEEFRTNIPSDRKSDILSEALLNAVTRHLRHALNRIHEQNSPKSGKSMTAGAAKRPFWLRWQFGTLRSGGISA